MEELLRLAPAPAPVPVLALVTTFHLCLVLLLHHRSGVRSGVSLLLLPSVALAASPWALPTPLWLVTGCVGHVAWFLACRSLPPLQPAAALAAHGQAPSLSASAVAPVAAARPSPPPSASRPVAAVAPGAVTPAHPGGSGFTPQPVIAVFQESEDVRTFRILRPEGLEFTAGQFLSVRVLVDGKPLVRCYSISSAPEAAGYLELSIKKLGQVSSTLHATVRPGSMLAIKGAAGKFTYPEGDDRPLVLLAGGIGITPLMSMFRHGLASEPLRPITLVVAVRNERQLAFRRELAWLAERHPQARVVFVVQEGPFTLDRSYHAGVITESLLREVVPDVASSIFMLCGPAPMMDAMKKLLASLSVPEAQVRWEEFSAAIALAKEPVPRPGPVPRRAPATAGAAPAPAEPVAAAGAFTVTLQHSGLTLPASRGQTILEAVEAGGASIPTSCRAGICMCCRTRLVAGDAQCDSDSLDDRDRAEGFILPCVSWPKSDCVIEA